MEDTTKTFLAYFFLEHGVTTTITNLICKFSELILTAYLRLRLCSRDCSCGVLSLLSGT